MVFSSLMFLFVYFSIVLLVYYAMPRKLRNLWLFIASLLFYGYGEPIYVLLMLASITVNYVMGLLMGRFRIKGKLKLNKWLLVLNVALNLGCLGYFKYAGFAADILNNLPFLNGIVSPEIALPIGISFYTFQTMSYTIDVYLGKCAPQKDYIAFGTYVCLFPQLIAGPIVRYVDIEYQLKNRRESLELFDRGVRLFVVGLCKKVLLANALGILWGDLKAMPEGGMLASWFGIIAFTLQIYFDFSGYSDMARGLGNMFGFEFVQNFNYPYLSNSVTDFWRRWHISLGSWFREYVYIPLGGNRCSKPRHIFNLAVTWLLTGLWHGASWNFILWGGYFGLLLILEKLFLSKLLSKLPSVIKHIYALFFIVVGWAIFDFTDMGQMGEFFSCLFTLENGIVTVRALGIILSWLPTVLISIFACLPLGSRLWHKLDDKKIKPVLDAVIIALGMILCIASLVSSSYNPFLYFRF